ARGGPAPALVPPLGAGKVGGRGPLRERGVCGGAPSPRPSPHASRACPTCASNVPNSGKPEFGWGRGGATFVLTSHATALFDAARWIDMAAMNSRGVCCASHRRAAAGLAIGLLQLVVPAHASE